MKQTSLKRLSSSPKNHQLVVHHWTLRPCILHLGLLFWHPSIQRNLVSFFILQAGIFWSTSLSFFRSLQTVVPIIPGALTSVAGVFIYGHIIGTIYNYIGIVIGCAIIFHLARMYGPKFVQSMVSQKPTTSTLAGSMKASGSIASLFS